MSIFDASESALGFAYQERQALLIAIRRADESPSHELTIETLDDVGITSVEGATVWQIKNTQAPITNAAPDLWKTIRVWCTNVQSGHLAAEDTTFFLLAASSVSNNSAAWFLRDDKNRDIAKALELLSETANISKNLELKASFDSFKALTDAKKTQLFSNVYILDGSPDIVEVRQEIEHEVRWATLPERRKAFVDRLEGWWHDAVIKLQSKSGTKSMSLGLVGSQLQTLRREMDESNLPIDFGDASPNDEQTASFQNKTFVFQMRLIGLNRGVIHAIRDYYRAGLQRNKWIGDSLLYTEQLDAYALRLEEEWQRHYDSVLDEMGEEAGEEEMRRLGRELFNWMQDKADLRIVPECDAPFIRRGSYHILADSLKVGWHPMFEQRLKSVVTGAVA